MGRAQREDPACQEVLTWFGGDPSPARPPTLRPEETNGDLKWFNSRFEKLRLVHLGHDITCNSLRNEAGGGTKKK